MTRHKNSLYGKPYIFGVCSVAVGASAYSICTLKHFSKHKRPSYAITGIL